MEVFRSSLHLDSMCEEVSFINLIFFRVSDLFPIYLFVCVCVVGNNPSVCVCMPIVWCSGHF